MFRTWLPFLTALATSAACSSSEPGSSGTAGRPGFSGGPGSSGSPGTAGKPSGGSAGSGATAGAAGGGQAGGAGSSSVGGSGGASGGGGGAAGGAGTTGAAGSAAGAFSSMGVTGWAAMPGKGVETTTGGGDATPVSVSTIADLNMHAAGMDPKVIHVSGQLTGRLNVGSNKTIIGMAGAEIRYVSGACPPSTGTDVPPSGRRGACTLSIFESQNVIVRNIKFVGVTSAEEHLGDSGQIENSHHVWIDHCEFQESDQGLLDIMGSSDFITVSWTKFGYTTKHEDHLGMIMGTTNAPIGGPGHMNLTLHHNWWGENIVERMPRARFGKVHIFNNLYAPPPNTSYYAIRPGVDSNVRSENNIYKNFKGMSQGAWANSFPFSYHDTPNGILQSIGDVFENCAEMAADQENSVGGTMSRGTAFTPPYTVTLDPTDTLEAKIMAGAGPR